MQRVAQTYLLDDRRVTVRYLDESQRPAGEKPAPDLAQFSPKVTADVLPVGLKASPPPASLPTTPPAPTAPIAATPPRIAERTLSNGLRVIVAKTSDVPMVTAELTMKSGGAADPLGLAGVADMTSDLLPKGTATRSATDIAVQIEAAGGSLKTETSYDGSGLTLTVLADQLAATLPIMSDRGAPPGVRPRRDRAPAPAKAGRFGRGAETTGRPRRLRGRPSCFRRRRVWACFGRHARIVEGDPPGEMCRRPTPAPSVPMRRSWC